MKSIAIVTSSEQTSISPDDRFLQIAMQKRGVTCFPTPWDGENQNWKDFEVILLRSCWNYYKKADQFYGWLNNISNKDLPILNDVHTVLWNLNKTYLKELEANKICIPDTLWFESTSALLPNLKSILYEKPWNKAVIKPCISAGSFQTIIVSKESIESDHQRLKGLDFSGGLMLQEFSDEIVSQGELSFVFFGNEFSHAVLKSPKRGDFRVQSAFGGKVENYEPEKELLKQAYRVIEFIEPRKTAYARVDGFVRNNCLVLMELELIEPSLFLGYHPEAAEVFADQVLRMF